MLSRMATWNDVERQEPAFAARVRALFPPGRLVTRRLTLAPPLARAAVRLHPGLYPVFNALPFLRSHLLCWIAKD